MILDIIIEENNLSIFHHIYFPIILYNNSMEVMQVVTFIKDYSLDTIKSKLWMLYLLNITDIVFTILLLSTGYYIEANFFMTSAVQDPVTSVNLKVILPAIVLLYVYYRAQFASNVQLKKTNVVISAITLTYAVINLSHLIWFAILPIFIMVSF